MAHHIVTLPGDGIGPEIMAPTLALLTTLGDFEFEEHLFGGASIDAHGIALTDDVLEACKAADAVLLAAVGIYGLLNYWVAVRENDIAIRMALGAPRWSIARWTGWEALRLAAMGIALGVERSKATTLPRKVQHTYPG